MVERERIPEYGVTAMEAEEIQQRKRLKNKREGTQYLAQEREQGTKRQRTVRAMLKIFWDDSHCCPVEEKTFNLSDNPINTQRVWSRKRSFSA